MDCSDARTHLLDLGRRSLPPALLQDVQSHLDACLECRQAAAAERALDKLLEDRLPRHASPPELRMRMEAMLGSPSGARPAGARYWTRLIAPALAAALAMVLGGLLVERRTGRESAALAALTDEAVTDHLRVLASQHPMEVESGGSHDVKPWFEGRLDFAPQVIVPKAGDLRLKGGAVGYFLDRKAAVVQYSLRLHAVTLVVFRAEGLRWPAAHPTDDPVPLTVSGRRGFTVVLWRSGELGHALVSDVSETELLNVASMLSSGSPE
jgi:anti-sigma factor RsiW